jgi:biopolymer transport protein ExbD
MQQAEDDHPRVTVNILGDGQIALRGESLSVAELTRRLTVEAAQAESDVEVRVRGDRSVQYRHVEPILLACAKSGIWNVTFSVIERNQ